MSSTSSISNRSIWNDSYRLSIDQRPDELSFINGSLWLQIGPLLEGRTLNESESDCFESGFLQNRVQVLCILGFPQIWWNKWPTGQSQTALFSLRLACSSESGNMLNEFFAPRRSKQIWKPNAGDGVLLDPDGLTTESRQCCADIYQCCALPCYPTAGFQRKTAVRGMV